MAQSFPLPCSSKLYDMALGETIKARLAQLEARPQPEPKVTTRQIIEQFKDAARQAIAKGYTLAEIGQIAREAGLEVSVATLKTYLQSRKVKKKRPEAKPKATAKPTQAKLEEEEAVAMPSPESTPLPRHAGFNEEN